MADFYGSNYTKQYINKPSEKAPAGEVSGGIMVAYDEITIPQDVLAQNDIIKLGLKVPKGARIHEAVLLCPSTGTTGQFDLGTSANSDALIAAADAGGQAVKAMTTAASSDLGKELTEDTLFEVKVVEATDAAEDVVLKAWILYTYV